MADIADVPCQEALSTYSLLDGTPYAYGLPVIVGPRLHTWKQVRFPRSKKRRIRKKWAKDRRRLNHTQVPMPYGYLIKHRLPDVQFPVHSGLRPASQVGDKLSGSLNAETKVGDLAHGLTGEEPSPAAAVSIPQYEEYFYCDPDTLETLRQLFPDIRVLEQNSFTQFLCRPVINGFRFWAEVMSDLPKVTFPFRETDEEQLRISFRNHWGLPWLPWSPPHIITGCS